MSIPSVHQTTNLGPCDHHDDDEQSEWCQTKTKANSFILLFTAPFERWKYVRVWWSARPHLLPHLPSLPTGHQRNDLPDTQPLTPSHAPISIFSHDDHYHDGDGADGHYDDDDDDFLCISLIKSSSPPFPSYTDCWLPQELDQIDQSHEHNSPISDIIHNDNIVQNNIAAMWTETVLFCHNFPLWILEVVVYYLIVKCTWAKLAVQMDTMSVQ